MTDSASSTNALEADIREDCDELADGRSGRSAFLSDIKPSDQRCVTRVGRLCDLTGKLSLSTEEFRLGSMLIYRLSALKNRTPALVRDRSRGRAVHRATARDHVVGRTAYAGVRACPSGCRPQEWGHKDDTSTTY